MKILSTIFAVLLTFSAAAQGQKFSGYPNTSSLQAGDLFLISRGGQGTFNINQAQLTNTLGLQLHSANLDNYSGRATNTFDGAGAGVTAATAATNGFPWGSLYDPATTAAAVGLNSTNNTFAVSNLLAALSQTIANASSNSLQTGLNTLGSNLTNDVNTASNALQSQITAGGITAVQATNIDSYIASLSNTVYQSQFAPLTATNDLRALLLTNGANQFGGTLVGGTNTLQISSSNGVAINGPLIASNVFQLGPGIGALVYNNNHVVAGVNNAIGGFLVGDNSGSYTIDHSYFFSGQGFNGSFFNIGAGVAINTNNVPSHGKLDVWGNGWFSGSVTAAGGFAGDGSAVTNLQTSNITGLLDASSATANGYAWFGASTNLFTTNNGTGWTNLQHPESVLGPASNATNYTLNVAATRKQTIITANTNANFTFSNIATNKELDLYIDALTSSVPCNITFPAHIVLNHSAALTVTNGQSYYLHIDFYDGTDPTNAIVTGGDYYTRQ
jgi:hypothetical protein